MDDKAPLIFWILAGYYRNDPEKFKAEGLFRITSSNKEVRKLELHMSQENFPYLNQIKNA